MAHLIVAHSVAAFTEHSVAHRRIVAAGRPVGSDPARDTADPSGLQVVALRCAQEIGVWPDRRWNRAR